MLEKKEICRLGEDLLARLQELGRPQYWLVDQVSIQSGLYFDRAYLSKIKKGRLRSAHIVESICKVLEIPCLPEYTKKPVL